MDESGRRRGGIEGKEPHLSVASATCPYDPFPRILCMEYFSPTSHDAN